MRDRAYLIAGLAWLVLHGLLTGCSVISEYTAEQLAVMSRKYQESMARHVELLARAGVDNRRRACEIRASFQAEVFALCKQVPTVACQSWTTLMSEDCAQLNDANPFSADEP